MSAVLENVGGQITHHFSDGLYAKEAFVPEGTAILKHTHDFSHTCGLVASRTVYGESLIPPKRERGP